MKLRETKKIPKFIRDLIMFFREIENYFSKIVLQGESSFQIELKRRSCSSEFCRSS